MTLSGSLRGLQHAALLRPVRQRPALTRQTDEREARRGAGEGVTLGGVPVKLLEFDEAVDLIIERAVNEGLRPLGIASANLDHIKHFGQGSRWEDTLERQTSVEWLTLLDGAPLVTQAENITGRPWPRLAGSDLIWPVLDAAEAKGLTVGFVGGTPDVHAQIRDRFATAHHELKVAGWWAPERSSLSDAEASEALAAEIRESGPDILVVCLGKPRQELWISEYGHLTGAKVMLAFGAVVDFLAGRVRRAPSTVRRLGMEWAWRLALEPRRLANRYLVDGPEAYVRLRRFSGAVRSDGNASIPIAAAGPFRAGVRAAPGTSGSFLPVSQHTDVAVLVVTYNSEKDIPGLLKSLRTETTDQSIKVIVADNSPTPATLRMLADETDVFAFPTGGNLGYAGAINAAMTEAGSADAYLVLNPDMRVRPGSVAALRGRMSSSGAGVVVPLLLDDDGTVYPSLRREPSVSRALGDAVMGSKLPGRPGWMSEIDFDTESYAHPHKVDWATGAALLIRADVAERVGNWDEEYFLYSEETDFLHRVRATGSEVWFEPHARMVHCRGASGSSPALDALLAANRIRYVHKFRPMGYARAFRAAVLLSALLRTPLPHGGEILAAMAREKRWDRLPHAARYEEPADCHSRIPTGAVIIPAHNEASVIRRTLEGLSGSVAAGALEVIVACNGCEDATAAIARSFPGVHVIDVPEASKVAALNAGDAAATRWPRLYLDADVELPVEALYTTLELLSRGGTVLCARPTFVYDTDGATWPVRAYYRARQRLPLTSQSIWGAGVYGLNRAGHDKLGHFPAVTADDCFIDRLFSETEKAILEGAPVTVRTPRSARALLATLKRVYRGNAELRGMEGSHTRQTVRELTRTVHGPFSAVDAAAYSAFALLGRLSPRHRDVWERDDSSRG